MPKKKTKKKVSKPKTQKTKPKTMRTSKRPQALKVLPDFKTSKPETLPPAPEKKKIIITNDLRRIWFRVRNTWNRGYDAFYSTISLLNDKEANMLYEVVRHSLYTDFYAEIIRKHPELKEFIRSDDDRLCMHDVYAILSWRLNKQEKLPKDKEITMKMKGRIGREVPVFE